MSVRQADLEQIAQQAKRAPGACRAKEACVIVGAYQHPHTVEMLYLVEWVHFDGPDKVEWIPDRDIGGYDSLSDKLTDEGITVWWGQQGATALNTLRT